METNEEITLFEKLKKIRLDKNISLKTIARDSRIQINYLEAIEAGEFDKIPAVYDKLFFQTYLSYLNIPDTNEYIAEYKALRKEAYQPSPSTTLKKIKSNSGKQHPIFNLKILFIVAPAVLIILIIGFMAWNTESIGDSANKKVVELPVRKIVQEMAEVEKAKTDSLQQVKTGKLVLNNVSVNIEAVEKTWLRYIKDNRDTLEYMLTAGNKISVQADSVLYFLVGNASGARFIINGENKGILGKTGEVISYLKITAKGIEGQRNKSVSN